MDLASPIVNDYFDLNDPALCVRKRSSLNVDDKLTLLTSKFKCPPNFVFPATSGRRFSLNWTVYSPWLRYSVSNDSAYCLPCLCFANVDNDSPFSSMGFNKWKKALSKKSSLLDKHKGSEAHKLADEKACLFPKNSTTWFRCCFTNGQRSKIQQACTKKGILTIIDVVAAFGKRGIAFRGNWDKITKTEDGNFSFCELEVTV